MKRPKMSRWAYLVVTLAGMGVAVPVSLASRLVAATFELPVADIWSVDLVLFWAALGSVGLLFGRWQPVKWAKLGAWAGVPLAVVMGPLNFAPLTGPHDTQATRWLASASFLTASMLGAYIGSHRRKRRPYRKPAKRRRSHHIYQMGS